MTYTDGYLRMRRAERRTMAYMLLGIGALEAVLVYALWWVL